MWYLPIPFQYHSVICYVGFVPVSYVVCCSIDGSRSNNSLGRMVNDAKVGNSVMRKVMLDNVPHLCLFATRDIQQGEQLFFDYGDDCDRLYWRQKVDNILLLLLSTQCISIPWSTFHIADGANMTRAPPRALCSSDAPMLVLPRIHTELARRAFSVAAPSTWNSLPADIRLCENILTFKRHLKTHLFKLT